MKRNWRNATVECGRGGGGGVTVECGGVTVEGGGGGGGGLTVEVCYVETTSTTRGSGACEEGGPDRCSALRRGEEP